MKYNTVRGMRDLLPEEAKKKEYIIDTCKTVFKKYGFQPLETPVVEEFALLAKKGGAGEEIRNELYYFKDKSGRELGLRFDLTVSLARFVASNPGIPKPFKRYQTGTVYRYDRPQAGRYREFCQADIDIIGTGNMMAEFEIISATADIMKRLGLKAEIRVSNRKVLEEIALQNGVKKSQIIDCFRCLDKLEKIGTKEVEKELEQKEINTQILGKISWNSLEKCPECTGKKELSELFEYIRENNLGDFARLSLSIARGLEYYTGTVFEVKAGGMTVAAGGRYDNLIALYGGEQTPAVGISFGVDRMIDIVEKIPGESVVKVFVAPIGGVQKQAAGIAGKIREAGIACELDLMQRNISKNLEYARKKGMRIVLLLGEEELKNKSVTLRDMETGKQETVRQNEIVQELEKNFKSELVHPKK